MQITSAKFVKGVVCDDKLLENGIPQIAFIGRSNVGKSSVINSLCGQKNLARSSSFPGCTQEINLFLINNAFYVVDLPGYGFAKASQTVRMQLEDLVCWYLFNSKYEQRRTVLIIDAKVGPTQDDLDMLASLKERKKNIVIVANKIDKISQSERKYKLKKMQDLLGVYSFIPYSAEKKIGISDLIKAIFL